MRHRCPGCGKPAPKKTEYHSVGQQQRLEDPDWWRRLPGKITHKHSYKDGQVDSVDTWDGVSYQHKYDPFCTLRCALQFARAAHMAGYYDPSISKEGP
jgi:hypothetical protein